MDNYLNKEAGDVVKVEVKSAWESKTLWLNVVTLFVQIVMVVQNSALIADNPEILALLASINAVLNIILRFISNSPVTLKR